MKNQKKYKNLKPIDYEISFIYGCPGCRYQHWLSMNEASTKNFKVVCDCGVSFKVKPIKQIEIIYQIEQEKKEHIDELTNEIVNKCVTILDDYGFSKTEAVNLIYRSYKENKSVDIGTIIKFCISNLEL
jgi:hypothetical protein